MAETLDADFQRQVLAAFAAETEERLQAITNHLLALEKEPDAGQAQQLLKDIFREAHTLKGGARVLDLAAIEKVTHRLESLFGLLQNGTLQPQQNIFDLVYRALDIIGLLMREATTGSAAGIDVTELCTQLDDVRNIEAKRDTAKPAVKDAEPAPIIAAPSVPVALAPPPVMPAASVQEVRLPPKGGTTNLVPSPPSAEAPPAPVQEVRASSTEIAPRPADETVRVAIAKLDALMAQVGELQVARIGADQRLPEARALVDLCETWEARWRRFRSEYRRHIPAAANKPSADADKPSHQTATAMANRAAMLEAFLELNASNLRTMLGQLVDLRRAIEDDSRRMAHVLAELQDDVRRVRMLPIATVLDTFPRMVRDLARDLSKEVALTVAGGDNEMDRSLLEQIKGPLIHLVRNAIDHGLEAPAARQAAGKSAQGSLTLTASQRGGCILIEVADDGAGIDVARVKSSAVRKGWLTPDAADAMSDREALWLIFRSGLSTKVAVTDVSGRGVGLDVVHDQVCRLGGLIDIDTTPGQGTRFALRLPLTVATTLCLLVQAGGQTFALPITNVVRITRIRPGEVGSAGGRPVIVVDGRPIAVTHLAAALSIDAAEPRTPPASGSFHTAVILGAAERRIAFLVADVVSAQEVVIKKLPPPLLQLPLVAGVTILGTGEVVMVPNIAALLRAPASPAAGLVRQPEEKAPPTVVVADDSITTRMLEKNVLEAAGYRVRLAADGLEAWNVLQEGGCDLLITDGEMPRLDGFGLAQKVRGDDRLKDLPIILITSLDSAEDKERGIRAGADAYVVKSAFDHEKLLAAIGQLI
jgi:two-component system chemotaxis sensor kinase CheA